jgi:LysR family cys regulon transcriptional activator
LLLRERAVDLQHLKIIQQTVDCGFNLTKVAQTLYTSQPGISRQIRALEEELGTDLFIRVGRRLVDMTAPGREVFAIAKRVLADVRDIQNVPARFMKSDTGILRFAATPMGCLGLPRLFERLCGQYPDVRIALRRQAEDAVCAALCNDAADFAFAGERLRDSRDIVCLPCASLPYALVVPEGHPLGEQPYYVLEDLGAFPLLTYNAGLEERLYVDNAFSAAGVTPNVTLTADDSLSLVHSAQLGLGVAVLCASRETLDAYAALFTGIRILNAVPWFGEAALYLCLRRGKLLRDFERRCLHLALPDSDPAAIQEMLLSRDAAPFVLSFSI